MSQPEYIATEHGRRLAYRRRDGAGPAVVFLHGLRSDMEGTKALHLDDWARTAGRAFVRFDCSGHGQSDGTFEDGCIGDWAEDARAILSEVTEGPVVLVGSSMGGWLALLMARAMPERVAGLVTIAAAPDFTEDGFWAEFTEDQKAEMEASGQVALPSEYGEPLVVTQRMIEDGRSHLVLRAPLDLPFPTRFLQGTADADVDVSVALRLLEHADGPDMRLTLVKGADHRFSEPAELATIVAAVEDVSGSGSGGK
ncbi:alpha/beta fold hydrolase [Tropicimonas isoalkanivorans]|uniref:Palmitoyl-protein thioesterase ABHD10, mitochondrial n=1 Tax=Tropicimonas isoalkanivorans TaxID=441112 RepID=A0A1I1FW25_9RHOB|nr:alpha/beta hydrolase [Tropicimonas isoalkanivorans]SFC03534.1 Pimeloyl-ACP methyl ester carboxylesterase [Tropicimonas isoalkanivorans]